MNDYSFSTIKNYYSNFDMPVFCCDDKFEITWSNASAQKFKKEYLDFTNLVFFKLKQFDENNKTFFSFYVADKNIIAHLICSKLNESQSCFVQLDITEKDYKPSPIFCALNNYIYSLENQYRGNVNEIFNLLPHIYRDLEKKELYDSIKYLKKISANAYKILKTTVNYGEYYKLVDTNTPILKTTVNITSELDQLFTLVKANLFRSNIDFSYNIPSYPILMSVDIEKLNFAVLNMISNSCQYSGTQNTVYAEAFEKNDSLVLQISDRGIGISPDQYKNIFTPFYSYDPDTGSQSGAGLGLSYASLFAERMDGACIITGDKNKGTSVILKLPLGETECCDELTSNLFQYSTGKFSPVTIILSDACEIPIN